jgi:hypothetical protein
VPDTIGGKQPIYTETKEVVMSQTQGICGWCGEPADRCDAAYNQYKIEYLRGTAAANWERRYRKQMVFKAGVALGLIILFCVLVLELVKALGF